MALLVRQDIPAIFHGEDLGQPLRAGGIGRSTSLRGGFQHHPVLRRLGKGMDDRRVGSVDGDRDGSRVLSPRNSPAPPSPWPGKDRLHRGLRIHLGFFIVRQSYQPGRTRGTYWWGAAWVPLRDALQGRERHHALDEPVNRRGFGTV